jgi:hypothetical protein
MVPMVLKSESVVALTVGKNVFPCGAMGSAKHRSALQLEDITSNRDQIEASSPSYISERF